MKLCHNRLGVCLWARGAHSGTYNILGTKCGQLRLNYIDILQLKLQMMTQEAEIFESHFNNIQY